MKKSAPNRVISRGGFPCIQAKQYDENKVPREKIDAFYATARRENAAAMVYVTTSRYSSEAIDAALTFGVRLVDGAELVD